MLGFFKTKKERMLEERVEQLKKGIDSLLKAHISTIPAGQVAVLSVPELPSQASINFLVERLNDLSSDFYADRRFGLVFICGAQQKVVIGGKEEYEELVESEK